MAVKFEAKQRMGITNPCSGDDYLNKNHLNGQYSLYTIVNSGNMKDTAVKNVNGKVVTGKIFNQSYTLLKQGSFADDPTAYEEIGRLANWYDPMFSEEGYRVYGNPNKFVYDYKQKYNNCGVNSSLNILSMAGKISLVEPTEELVAELTKPVTVRVKNKYHDSDYVTVTPNVDVTSTEELITLYAIQNGFAQHVYDLDHYKTVADINPLDGGTNPTGLYDEQNFYHYNIYSQAELLNQVTGEDFASVVKLKNPIVCLPETGSRTLVSFSEDITEEPEESEEPQNAGNNNTEENKIKDTLKEYHLYLNPGVAPDIIDPQDENPKSSVNARGDVYIKSQSGNDTLVFEETSLNDIWTINSIESTLDKTELEKLGLDDLNLNDRDSIVQTVNRSYNLAKSGRDLYILYSPTSFVQIVNYFPSETGDNDEEEMTCITNVQTVAKDKEGNIIYLDRSVGNNNQYAGIEEIGDDYILLRQSDTDESGQHTYKRYDFDQNDLIYYSFDEEKTDTFSNKYYRKYENTEAQGKSTDILIRQDGDHWYQYSLELENQRAQDANGDYYFILPTNYSATTGSLKNLDDNKIYRKYVYKPSGEGSKNLTYYVLGNADGTSESSSAEVEKDLFGNDLCNIYIDGVLQKENVNSVDINKTFGLTKRVDDGETYYVHIAKGATQSRIDDTNQTVLIESGSDNNNNIVAKKYSYAAGDITYYVLRRIDTIGGIQLKMYGKYVNGVQVGELEVLTADSIDPDTNIQYYTTDSSGLLYAFGTDRNGNTIYVPKDSNYVAEKDESGADMLYYLAEKGDSMLEDTFQLGLDGQEETEDIGGNQVVARYIQIGKDIYGNLIIAKESEYTNADKWNGNEQDYTKYYYAGQTDGQIKINQYTAYPYGKKTNTEYQIIGQQENGNYVFAQTGVQSSGTYYYIGADNNTKLYSTVSNNAIVTPDGDMDLLSYYAKYGNNTYKKMVRQENGEYVAETNGAGQIVEYTSDDIRAVKLYNNFDLHTFVDDLYGAREISGVLNYSGLYTTDIMETNVHKYGSMIKELAQYVREGRGILIGGNAESLSGKQDVAPRNHAIVLTGVAYEDKVIKEDGASYILSDIAGFYVVDTGGFLDSGVQFITCEQFYNFFSCSSYDDSEVYYESYLAEEIPFVATNYNIKAWAEELNMSGNAMSNTLYGNQAKNVLRGGGSLDNLYGLGGNDTLYGDSGNDWLWGGKGNDTLYGGSGTDTYIFEVDDGAQEDTVYYGSGKDTLRFENWKKEDITAQRVGYDLVLNYNNSKTYKLELSNNKELLFEDNIKDLAHARYTETEVDPASEDYFESKVVIKDFYKKYVNGDINIIGVDEIIQNHITGQTTVTKISDFLNTAPASIFGSKFAQNSILGSRFSDNILLGNRNNTVKSGAGNDIITTSTGISAIRTGSGNDTVNIVSGNNKIWTESGENQIVFKENATGYTVINQSSAKDSIDFSELTVDNNGDPRALSPDDLQYRRSGNNLVILYDDKGSSVTVTNYFAKNGKTSVQSIQFKNSTLNLVDKYDDLKDIEKATTTISDNNVDIVGSDIDDVVKGTKENDVIIGGFGNDKLYGQGGSDTFKFNTIYEGSDIVYTSGSKNDITLDLSGIITGSETVNEQVVNTYLTLEGDTGFVGGFNDRYLNDNGANHAYSKVGNDLVINYGQNESQEVMSNIRIANYFTSGNNFFIKTIGNDSYDLKNATIFFEGEKEKANRITGSKQNDLIYGGDLNDTISAGIGDDTIIGSAGNDKITAGKGQNTIVYNASDFGTDTITLTKDEELTIDLSAYGFTNKDELNYRIVGKNLEIEVPNNEYQVNYGVIKLVNFATTNATGKNKVNLVLANDVKVNLVDDYYLNEINDFSAKKKSYTGNYHSEIINASGSAVGVSINGGAGNDIITGSTLNDTLKGGDGNDILIGNLGKNTMDGGNGSDTYYLFGKKEVCYDANHNPQLSDYFIYLNTAENDKIIEESIIKDTGKSTYDKDTAIINANKEDLRIVSKNISKTSTIDNFKGTIEIKDSDDNTAKLTGIENIEASGYKCNMSKVIEDVAGWLSENNYQDVNSALNALKNSPDEINELYALFNNENVWVQIN